MQILLTITIALPIICGEYQELELIRKLNNYFDFDHNILLLDKSIDINRLINTREDTDFVPSSIHVFKTVDGNITGITRPTRIKSKNIFLIVSPGHSNFEKIQNLLILVKKIQRLRINMKIGLFFQEVTSSEDLQKLFEWSWKERIINIFAATYLSTNSTGSLNIFTFNPFGIFNVVNVTSSNDTIGDFFLSQNSNFQQHPLRVMVRSKDYFWPVALRAMNASYTELQFNDSSRKEVMENQFDVCMGALISIYPNPMAIVNFYTVVIIVPEALVYGEFAAYLKAITKDAFFGYSLVIFIGVILILTIVRYIAHRRHLFLESVADVLNLLMNDNSSIEYQRLHRSELFLIVPLTFVGMVIVNGIFSNLQSYLTQPILQPQVHTVEDLYNCPFPILTQTIYQKNKTIERLSILSKHKDWDHKIRVDANVNLIVETYNRSLAYLSPLHTANQLLRVQKKLGIKGYHITERHIEKYFNSYIVHDAFPFIERLNEIIQRLQSAGLYDEWDRRTQYLSDKAFLEQKVQLFANRTQTPQNDDADTIVTYPIPMFIVYGWIGGTVVLIAEIIWNKLGFQFSNKCCLSL